MGRTVRSGVHLAQHFAEVLLLLIGFGRTRDGSGIYPAIWSAMLAARAEGLGCTLTGMLWSAFADEVFDLLGVPKDAGWYLQGSLQWVTQPGSGESVRGSRSTKSRHAIAGKVTWDSPCQSNSGRNDAVVVAPGERHKICSIWDPSTRLPGAPVGQQHRRPNEADACSGRGRPKLAPVLLRPRCFGGVECERNRRSRIRDLTPRQVASGLRLCNGATEQRGRNRDNVRSTRGARW